MVSLAVKVKMQILRAGTCKDRETLDVRRKSLRLLHDFHVSRLTSHVSRGFTLIELLVVLSILSITLTFVIPRLMGKEEAELKSSSRRLLYTIRRLSDEALFKKEKKVLSINIDKGEYWEEEKGRKSTLPDGISVAALTVGKKEMVKGTVSVAFFPSGFRDETEIRLKGREGKEYTVVVPALGERFEVREK